MKTTISITRALVELKRLDSRIQQAIASGTYVAQTSGLNANQKLVGRRDTSIETIKSEINASFQSVDKLIANRSEIKAAIVKSNANTMVKLGKREISVAEAIDMKAQVPYLQMYKDRLQAQLAAVTRDVEQNNMKMEAEIQASVQAMVGSAVQQASDEMLKMVNEAQRSQKERKLLGEDKIKEKIAEVEAQILDIETELDFVLSESNALTTVEVNL